MSGLSDVYTHDAQGATACIPGTARLPVSQLICYTSSTLKSALPYQYVRLSSIEGLDGFECGLMDCPSFSCWVPIQMFL